MFPAMRNTVSKGHDGLRSLSNASDTPLWRNTIRATFTTRSRKAPPTPTAPASPVPAGRGRHPSSAPHPLIADMAACPTEATIEIELYRAGPVDVYRPPPRPPHGHKAGDWSPGSCIASGLDVALVEEGADRCSVRLLVEAAEASEAIGASAAWTGAGTGGWTSFAACPLRAGRPFRLLVEPASDSSRFFVLRVENAATRQHGEVGDKEGSESHRRRRVASSGGRGRCGRPLRLTVVHFVV